jgi:hypothetical protein
VSIINATFLSNRTESLALCSSTPKNSPQNPTTLRKLRKQTGNISTCYCTHCYDIPRVISTNFPSAFGSLFRSGWYFLLSRLYAFLMSASDAERCTVHRTDVLTSKDQIYDPHIISVAYSRGFCSNLHQRKRGWCRRRRERACTGIARASSRLVQKVE